MRSIRHEITDFPKEDPFKNCILDREKYADNLTGIIKNYSQGFVLSINNKWGEGKTTFVKMWHNKLIYLEYESIFFNAWENDINQDALVAILGELSKKVDSKTEKALAEVLEKGSKIINKGLPLVARKIGSKLVGKEGVEELIEIAVENVSGIFEKNVENYKKQQESIEHFKTALEEFAKVKGNPLIIFIDELDRCKPNYAIDVLEKIKHFFNVPNVVFVLSIDRNQLANAVRGYYGSDKIDGEEYLRKFIDMEFSLPTNSNHVYIDFIYKKLNFESFFGPEKNQTQQQFFDKRDFLEFSKILSENSSLSPRELLQLFGKIRTVLYSFSYNECVFPTIIFFLIYLKYYRPEKYRMIRNKQISLVELIKFNKEITLNEKLEVKIEIPNILNLHEYDLFTTYSNYTEQSLNVEYFNKTKESFLVIYQNISIDTQMLHELLTDNAQYRRKEISLEFLFNKIELNSTLNFN